MSDFEIQPSVIETNLVPLDLAVTEQTQGLEIGDIPSTNSANSVPTNDNPILVNSNIISSGGGSIVKGFLKTQNFNAGSSGWSIDGNGNVEFNDGVFRGSITGATGTFSGSITATSGTIGGWTIGTTFIADNATAANANVLIDSTNDLIRLGPTSGNYITLDGANQRIRSSNYSAGVAGFTVEPNLIEAENLVARGIMKGATFAYDVISAVGGQLMVANADTLDTDMTALDASTLTTKGTTAFAVNDILVMRATTASGIKEEWLRVTSIASAPTYSVTRDLATAYAANSNPVWKAGTPVVKQGSSDGDSAYSGGWLRLFGEGTNSPYYSVFARTGVAYNAYTEVARMGNLNGFLDYASALYGFAAGNSDDYFSYDPTNGVRLNVPVSVDISFTAGEALTAGQAVGLVGEIYDATDTYHSATQATFVGEDNPTTNFDDDAVGIYVTNEAETETRYGLVYFPNLPEFTAGALKVEMECTFNVATVSSGGDYLQFHFNTGSFDQTTVTWNTKPAISGSVETSFTLDTGLNDTGWMAVTEAQYNNIRTYGVTLKLKTAGKLTRINDEDDEIPPKMKVRFTNRINNGKVWLTNATDGADDLQGSDYPDGFIGCAVSSVAAEASVKVRTEGKITGLSGLTPYAVYYLSNTDGAISTTSGFYTKIVGRALSADSLQVKYDLRTAILT